MGAGSWNAQTKHRVYVPLVPKKKAHTPSACNTQAWIHKATTQGKAIILLPCSVGVRHFIDEVKKSTTRSKICCSLLCAKTHQYCATCKLCAEKHVWLRKAQFIQRIFLQKTSAQTNFQQGYSRKLKAKKSTTGSKIYFNLFCDKSHQHCATCNRCAEKHIWLTKAQFVQHQGFFKQT